MLKIYLLILISPFVIFFHSAVFGQNKTEQDLNVSEPSYLKVGLDYISNNVYLGRKDSVSIPYITPSVGYYHRSGLFVEGSLSIVPVNGSGIDLVTVDGGYDFHNKNEKFSGELFAAKYFFTDSSNSVRSQINGEADAAANYDFGPVSINGGVDILFTSPVDLMLNAGLSHAFSFGSSYEWSVAPTFLANIGSLNFYESYYKKRKLKRRRGLPQTITVNGKNKFSVLDYEFALPLAYDTKKWSFLVSPYYAIPENPIQYYINGTFVKQEKLSNNFYLDASIAFKF